MDNRLLTEKEFGLPITDEELNQYHSSEEVRLTRQDTKTRAETLKETLAIVDKFWKQYCNFRDTKSCLEILGDIHDGIEALKRGELPKE